MEEINLFINNYGVWIFGFTCFLVIGFFILSIMDYVFSFWLLAILTVISVIVVNVLKLSWEIAEYFFVFGMGSWCGFAIAAPINVLIGWFSFTEAVGNKLSESADKE